MKKKKQDRKKNLKQQTKENKASVQAFKADLNYSSGYSISLNQLKNDYD